MSAPVPPQLRPSRRSFAGTSRTYGAAPWRVSLIPKDHDNSNPKEQITMKNQKTTDTSPATPTPDPSVTPSSTAPTEEQLATMFERTLRRTELARTLRVRADLNDYMRTNPALTLQEALLALFRNAERDLAELTREELADTEEPGR